MGGQTFLGKFIGGCSTWGTNDQIIPSKEKKSEDYKDEIFPQPWWDTHLKIKL